MSEIKVPMMVSLMMNAIIRDLHKLAHSLVIAATDELTQVGQRGRGDAIQVPLAASLSRLPTHLIVDPEVVADLLQ